MPQFPCLLMGSHSHVPALLGTSVVTFSLLHRASTIGVGGVGGSILFLRIQMSFTSEESNGLFLFFFFFRWSCFGLVLFLFHDVVKSQRHSVETTLQALIFSRLAMCKSLSDKAGQQRG